MKWLGLNEKEMNTTHFMLTPQLNISSIKEDIENRCVCLGKTEYKKVYETIRLIKTSINFNYDWINN
ncbi:hypothetical protein [Peribacillus frigoritolerans]|uniref:hypothetical protein n=1 Tax=Peribacillus frigoritolerans TaxID=450367 RepID=UPI002E23F2EB|nr:hypothetical protein [Peribacillus frigoritolerans]